MRTIYLIDRTNNKLSGSLAIKQIGLRRVDRLNFQEINYTSGDNFVRSRYNMFYSQYYTRLKLKKI